MNLPGYEGQILGQYELRELLGIGGMGSVFRAYQLNLQREVAIKLLSPVLASQPGYVERFNREARTAAALEHTHIIPIYDYGVQGDVSFVVMRLLSGGTLAQRLAQRAGTSTPLPSLVETRSLLAQLASALDYAHSQGVIHRDIKPSNVMFDNQGSAFLTDFGIAKLAGATSSLTGTSMVMGTPSYMPPEQWRGEALTPAADQYALAVMLYVLLTGRLPFEADTPFALMNKHVNESPTPPQLIRPEIPNALTLVLQRAMAKQPSERFRTTTAFVQAFEAAIEGQRAQNTQFFTFKLKAEPIQAGTTPSRSPVARASTQSRTTQPARSLRSLAPWILLGVGALAVLILILAVLSSSNDDDLTALNLRETSVALAFTEQALTRPPEEAQATSTTVPTSGIIEILPSETNTPTPDESLTATLLAARETQAVELTATYDAQATTDAQRSAANATATAASWTTTPTTTPSPTASPTDTPVPSATLTPLIVIEAFTPTWTLPPTATVMILTSTPAPTVTYTFTWTPTVRVITNTPPPTVTLTHTATANFTPTPTATATPTASPTTTPAATYTATLNPTATPTATWTSSPTVMASPTSTSTFTASPSTTPQPPATKVALAPENLVSLPFEPITADNADRLMLVREIRGDDGKLYAAAFSPDGRLLAVGGEETLQIRDTTTGRLEFTIPVHSDRSIYDIAFSPDGHLLAIALSNSTVQVWNLTRMGEYDTFTVSTLTSAARSVAFSPDGTVLAAGASDGYARMWDLNTGSLIQETQRGSQLAFSPDGSLLALSGGIVNSRGPIYVQETGTADLVWENRSAFGDIAFSPDGTRLAASRGGVGGEGTINFYDVQTGGVTRPPVPGGFWVAYNPVGDLIVTSVENRVLIWRGNIPKGDFELPTIHALMSPTFSPNDRLLVAVGYVHPETLWSVIGVWAVPEPNACLVQAPRDLNLRTGPSTDTEIAGAFNANEVRYVTGKLTGGDGYLWWQLAGIDWVRSDLVATQGGCDSVPVVDRITGYPLESISPTQIVSTGLDITQTPTETATASPSPAPTNTPTSNPTVASAPSATILPTSAVAMAPATSISLPFEPITAANADRLMLVREIQGNDGQLYTVAFSPDGTQFAVAGKDVLQIRDTPTSRVELTLPVRSDPVYAVAFSPNGHQLAAARSNAVIQLWDLDTTRYDTLVTGTQYAPYSLAYSPDGAFLASAGSDRYAHLWDLETHDLVWSREIGSQITISPDGSLLAAAGMHEGFGDVSILEFETGERVATIPGSYAIVAFSPEGTQLAAIKGQGQIDIIDLRNGSIEASLTASNNPEISGGYRVSFNPTGDLLTMPYSNHVMVWGGHTPLVDLEVETLGTLHTAVFSPDGQVLVAIGYTSAQPSSGIIDMWAVPAANACLVQAPRNLNLRTGPSTNAEIAGTFSADEIRYVTGRLTSNDGYLWWQLAGIDWVRFDLVSPQGDCSTVPEVDPATGLPLEVPTSSQLVPETQPADTPVIEAEMTIPPAAGDQASSHSDNTLQLALERARTFDGTNAEWEPYITPMGDIDMALVPAGCFVMGSNNQGEGPPHTVCFEAPFWINRTEVSNAQYGPTGSFEGDDRPREQIDWALAEVFCELRGGRLPTEAEWEYVARGPDGWEYPWGNTFFADHIVFGTSGGETAPVGSRPAGDSWIGAADMSGNVWEWVLDYWGPYPAGSLADPTGPTSGAYRSVRGGAFDNTSSYAQRGAYRSHRDASYQANNLGFRCVIPISSQP